jgi:hypothetical protein
MAIGFAHYHDRHDIEYIDLNVEHRSLTTKLRTLEPAVYICFGLLSSRVQLFLL